MNSKMTIEITINDKRTTPADYIRNSRREARKLLRLVCGFEPTERQVAAYILFGKKPLTGRTL